MSEEPNTIQAEFAELVSALRGGGMRFLLAGGLSLVAHHVLRATGDIDFACDKCARDLAVRLMTGLDYAILNEQPELCTRFHKSGRRIVDFIYLGEDTFAQLEAASVDAEVSRVRIRVPCLDHLLAMKLFSVSQSPTRGKDLGDILALIANNGVDVRSKEFEALCLKHASPKWLNLIRELA